MSDIYVYPEVISYRHLLIAILCDFLIDDLQGINMEMQMQSYAPPDGLGISTSLDWSPRSGVLTKRRIRPEMLDVCSVASLLLLIAICLVLVWETRGWTKRTAEQTELGVVETIASDISHNIERLNLAVSHTARALQLPGVWDLPQQLRQGVLFTDTAQMSDLPMILVIGVNGELRSVSDNQAPPAVNFSDREYFEFHRTHPDIAVRVSGPVAGQLGGKPMIMLSKRVNDAKGNFAGVVVGGIELSYFQNLFKKFASDNDRVIALLETSGQMIARLPADPGAEAIDISHAAIFSHAAQAFAGSYTSVSQIDGRERLVAYRAIEGFPFIVSYAQSSQDIFAKWLRCSIEIGATLLVLSCLKLVLIYELRRERRQRASAEESARRSAEALSVVNKDLEQRISREILSRKEAQEKLAKSQRLEALGQLAGGIAHDINNVLQTVSGACALAQECDADNDDVQRLTTIALSAADRGSAVTQRLLLFARRAAIKAEDVNTRAVLNDLKELLSHTLCGSVTLKFDLADALPIIRADRMQLETVIINLTTNARDAMTDGGTITIAVKAAVIGTGEAASSGLSPGRYVRMDVTDTGIGMDEHILSRATEPFFSTKGVGQGTGLGLSMAKGFAEQSNGKLEIASRVGEGTTVTLWMPASENAEVTDAIAPQAVTRRQKTGTKARALVVDDDTQARELVGEWLVGSGLEVYQAESGAAALSAVKAGLEVDLLLTDLSMPDMDGIQLIHEIRGIQPDLPAILLTGNTGAVADLPIGEPVGARYVVLQKPIRMRELVHHIERLLHSANTASVAA